MGDSSWNVLETEIREQLRLISEEVLEGAAEDLQKYAKAISASMILAIQREDPARVAELKAQLRGIAELNRLRAQQGAQSVVWGVLGRTLDVVFNVAIKALMIA